MNFQERTRAIQTLLFVALHTLTFLAVMVGVLMVRVVFPEGVDLAGLVLGGVWGWYFMDNLRK